MLNCLATVNVQAAITEESNADTNVVFDGCGGLSLSKISEAGVGM